MLVNVGFESFEGYAWFAGRFSAYVAIFVTVVWQSFPFIALSLLAALQTIPKETLQAAQVDGANAWNRFRLITLPLLRPVVAVLIVFRTIWDFKIFDQIYVMASGRAGPDGGHGRGRRLPRRLRARPLRPRQRGRRRAVPDPARASASPTCA